MKKLFVFLLAFFVFGVSGNIPTDATKAFITKMEKITEQNQDKFTVLNTSQKTPLSLGDLITALNHADIELAALEIKLKLISPQETVMKLQVQKMKDQTLNLQSQASRLESELKIIKTDPTRTQQQDQEKQQEIDDLRDQIKILLSDLQTIKTEMNKLEIEASPLK